MTRPDVICHGLTGEDAAELVRSAVRVSVKDGFKIIPVGTGRTLEFFEG